MIQNGIAKLPPALYTHRLELPDAVRNFADQVRSKAMLEALKNFLAAKSNNFTEPDTIVDRDEEGSFMQSGRLGMRNDIRID